MDSFSISDECENIVRLKFRTPKPYDAPIDLGPTLEKLRASYSEEIRAWIYLSLTLGFTAGIAVACLVARMAGVL
jgi:hypothetical protein